MGNRGATDNNGHEKPGWYTKDWPKNCQYNSPGCTLEEMETSVHASDIHRSMQEKNKRLQDSLAKGQKRMSLCFNQICDEDLVPIIERLKGDEDVLELDLTHNRIKDTGIQALVAGLAGGAAPNLKELRIYKNEFTKLGETMLTQGLKVFRKKLEIQVTEPDWGNLSGKTASIPSGNSTDAAAVPTSQVAATVPSAALVGPGEMD